MATVAPKSEELQNTTKSEKALKKDKWKADYKAWKPEQENEGRDWAPGKVKERVFPFYLISRLQVNAINTHNADIDHQQLKAKGRSNGQSNVKDGS
jgi:hypothetical protein